MLYTMPTSLITLFFSECNFNSVEDVNTVVTKFAFWRHHELVGLGRVCNRSAGLISSRFPGDILMKIQ